MSISGKSLFVGEFRHGLDAQKRLTIPSKWRFVGDEQEVFLALPNPIGCTTIYPPMMVAKLEEKAAAVSLGDPKGQKTLLRLFSQADTFGCDRQGRIHLNDRLLEHADLMKDVLLVGSYVTFSLWNPERYDAYIRGDSVNENEMTRLLGELGL
jgi:MraZ protein